MFSWTLTVHFSGADGVIVVFTLNLKLFPASFVVHVHVFRVQYAVSLINDHELVSFPKSLSSLLCRCPKNGQNETRQPIQKRNKIIKFAGCRLSFNFIILRTCLRVRSESS